MRGLLDFNFFLLRLCFRGCGYSPLTPVALEHADTKLNETSPDIPRSNTTGYVSSSVCVICVFAGCTDAVIVFRGGSEGWNGVERDGAVRRCGGVCA